jgi:hypothetical protein
MKKYLIAAIVSTAVTVPAMAMPAVTLTDAPDLGYVCDVIPYPEARIMPATVNIHVSPFMNQWTVSVGDKVVVNEYISGNKWHVFWTQYWRTSGVSRLIPLLKTAYFKTNKVDLFVGDDGQVATFRFLGHAVYKCGLTALGIDESMNCPPF